MLTKKFVKFLFFALCFILVSSLALSACNTAPEVAQSNSSDSDSTETTTEETTAEEPAEEEAVMEESEAEEAEASTETEAAESDDVEEAQASAETVELRFGHFGAPGSTATLAAEEFARLVEERSNGELVISLHPGHELGDAATMLQQVRSGALDMTMVGNPFFTSFAPEMNVLDLPFLFQSYDHAYEVLDGEIGRQLMDQLEAHNIKGLALWEIGFRNLTNSKRAVATVEDLAGLKIRTTPNPAHQEAFTLLGANPAPLPFAELYLALETGTVDGQENPVHQIYSQKFHEVQPYLSLTRHAYTTAPLVMNLDVFNNLSPDHQSVLLQAALEGAEFHRELNAELNEESLVKMMEEGVEVVEDPDVETFREIVAEPVRQSYIDQFGTDLLDQIDAVAQ